MGIRYAKIKDGVIVSQRTASEAIPIDQIRHVNGEPMLRPIIETTVDNSTGPNSVTSAAVSTIFPDRVEKVRTIRDMTVQEIDARKISQVDAVDQLQFKILFQHENRVRVLEGKPKVTVDQFRDALKGLL